MARRSTRDRASDYAAVVPLYPGRVRQAKLAALLRLPRSSVLRDLPYLEEIGVLLVEDDRGYISRVTKEILLTC